MRRKNGRAKGRDVPARNIRVVAQGSEPGVVRDALVRTFQRKTPIRRSMSGRGGSLYGGVVRDALVRTILGVAMGFLLAVYLLVAGIVTLRQSPRGATLHWVYVGLKVISTVCVAAGSTWLFHSAIQSIGRMTTTTAMPTMADMLPSTLFFAGLGLLYPIVLVILLRTRSAREYYRTGISAQ